MTMCACGCGGELDFSKGRKLKKYLKGHAARVDNKGGTARKGQSSWNKGIPRTTEEKQHISDAIKVGKANSTYKYTDLHKMNISLALKGHTKSKEWVGKIVQSRENNPEYEFTKEKISQTIKQKYKNGEMLNPFYIDGRWKNDPTSIYNLYGGQFTEDLKQIVRTRDMWTCQLCSKKRSTHVHHIDCNKLNNIETNLIVLCASCHAKHHHKSNTNFDNQKRLFEEIINGTYKDGVDL